MAAYHILDTMNHLLVHATTRHGTSFFFIKTSSDKEFVIDELSHPTSRHTMTDRRPCSPAWKPPCTALHDPAKRHAPTRDFVKTREDLHVTFGEVRLACPRLQRLTRDQRQAFWEVGSKELQ